MTATSLTVATIATTKGWFLRKAMTKAVCNKHLANLGIGLST